MEFVNDSSGIGSSRNNEGANLLDPIGSKTQYHATSHLRATIYWHAVENDIRPKMYITYPTLIKTFNFVSQVCDGNQWSCCKICFDLTTG